MKMKYRTTQKEIKNGYAVKIAVPYCGLQNLLSRKNPVAYTVRREGWGADIYEVNSSVAIVTGYAPFGNVRPSYELRQEYEAAAEKIRFNYGLNHEQQTAQLDELLQKFVEEVTNCWTFAKG